MDNVNQRYTDPMNPNFQHIIRGRRFVDQWVWDITNDAPTEATLRNKFTNCPPMEPVHTSTGPSADVRVQFPQPQRRRGEQPMQVYLRQWGLGRSRRNHGLFF